MEVSKKDLTAAMRVLAYAWQRKNVVPVLEAVAIDNDAPGRLRLRTTNLDMAFTAHIPAEGADGFEAACMFGDLRAALRVISSDGVTVERNDEFGMLVSGDDAGVQLRQLFPMEDFPVFTPKHLGKAAFLMPPQFGDGVLQSLLRAVAPAMSTEETRYHLNGVFLEVHPDGSKIRAAATNGHMLEVRDLELPAGTVRWAGGGTAVGIIPRAAVERTVMMKGPLVFNGGDRTTGHVAGPQGTLDFKMIDGEFPDYRRTIPAETTPVRFKVQAGPLRSAARRMLAIVGDINTSLHLVAGDGVMHLRHSKKGAVASVTIPAECGNDAVEIAVDARYLASIADGHTGEIRLAFDGAGSAIGIFSLAGLSVLMPRRISSSLRGEWRQSRYNPGNEQPKAARRG